MLFVSLVIVDTSIQCLSSFVDTLATNFHLLDRKCVRKRIRVKKTVMKVGFAIEGAFSFRNFAVDRLATSLDVCIETYSGQKCSPPNNNTLYGNFDVIMARTIWRSLDSALTIKLKYQAIIWFYYENVGKLNGYDRAQAQLILTFVCASLTRRFVRSIFCSFAINFIIANSYIYIISCRDWENE